MSNPHVNIEFDPDHSQEDTIFVVLKLYKILSAFENEGVRIRFLLYSMKEIIAPSMKPLSISEVLYDTVSIL